MLILTTAQDSRKFWTALEVELVALPHLE
jgi:hypothetical protein